MCLKYFDLHACFQIPDSYREVISTTEQPAVEVIEAVDPAKVTLEDPHDTRLNVEASEWVLTSSNYNFILLSSIGDDKYVFD